MFDYCLVGILGINKMIFLKCFFFNLVYIFKKIVLDIWLRCVIMFNDL